jgi:rhamnose utilization protein RhaD (predicted bifunctional aldolase and dehydrogenase)/NAD(P)-dependent dehydrogenase (short-subunit alcohol dehydrogenase family)
MDSLWDNTEAKHFANSDLQMRVYTSRLLGRNADLVLHGGGNTSVKITAQNLFGEAEDILYVKGSGWDLQTIEAAGFAPARLDHLKKLATLKTLSDIQMARELKASLIDPAAPAPSVEAILHAIIPFKFVDHTHTDAVVSISNTPSGETLLQSLFGQRVLILPYIMPGFMLAKQVYEATQSINWQQLDGIMLMHHGLFSFANDARSSYEKMIELVDLAENYLREKGASNQLARGSYHALPDDFLEQAAIRRHVSQTAGHAMLCHWKQDEFATGFSQLSNVADIASRGPLTPDHTLHTKQLPVILDQQPLAALDKYSAQYRAYFNRHNDGSLTCLDAAPRFAIWKNKGCLAFAPTMQRAKVVSDISDHTFKAIQWSEHLESWQALPEKDIFAIEYWELEQAKLKKVALKPLFEGKIALVSGGASGIGKACVEKFIHQGACVIGLDINPAISSVFNHSSYLGLVCDITDPEQVSAAIAQGIAQFGGLDIVVSNAGYFPPSTLLEQLDDETLAKSLDLNLSSHVRLIRATTPFLKLGIDPSIVIIASKNVPAPGPGAGAYSVAKAGLTQMARVAALELGAAGIRVNIVHPNAVFDTGIWNEQVLAERARHYGLSVQEYKRNNVLGTEVTSADVAALVAALAGPDFAKTTGAQLPIDGGNERVI